MNVDRIPDAFVLTSWRKSSYSGSENQDCVEVADGTPDVVPVRDSKAPYGPTLTFRNHAWQTFINSLNAGDFEGF